MDFDDVKLPGDAEFPTDDEAEAFFDNHPNLREDERMHDLQIVGIYVTLEALDQEYEDELVDEYQRIMNQAGYDPDDLDAAFDYVIELAEELERDYDLDAS